MKKLPSFQYIRNSKSMILDVILHGGSKGIESPFIQKVFNVCKEAGHSVIAFNFLYLEKGKESSSGPELKEELETLKDTLALAQYNVYEHVCLVGKSLGGMVASYFLDSLSEDEQKRFEIIVLGYIVGEVKLKNFSNKITIIQGEKDRFGNVQAVKNDLKNAKSKEITYHEILGADHSYRIPETKESVYEDQVIKLLKKLQ